MKLNNQNPSRSSTRCVRKKLENKNTSYI